MGKYRQPYTIYKRGKYWYYQTYDARGKRTTPKTTGKKTKIEAREYLDALYLSNDLVKSNVLFNSFAADFYAPNGLYFADRGATASKNTINQYISVTKRHLLPYFEGVKISDIDYLKLKCFRVFLAENNKAATVSLVMGVLKRIIDAAYRNDIINKNPFDKLEAFNSPLNIRDAFTLEEVKRLYNLIDPQYKNAVLIMALCGLRISELYGLCSEDIKEAGGLKYIDLRQQFCKGDFEQLKRNSVRQIPISDELENIIKQSNFLEHYGNIYDGLKPIKNNFENYDARGLSYHSLRHFFITNSKAWGVIESKVEILAGHKLKGVRGIYTNYKAEDLKEVIEWQKVTYRKIVEA